LSLILNLLSRHPQHVCERRARIRPVPHQHGDLRAALGRIKAKTFVMPMSSDMFFPPADCQAEWRLIPDAEFRLIQTIDGHLALFGADPDALSQLDKHLSELLATNV
jgi:homoserine O-acetyltransferase